jgi:hypothetical protein
MRARRAEMDAGPWVWLGLMVAGMIYLFLHWTV